jgi:hypothetical protein
VVIRKVLSKVWVVVLSEVQKESLGGGFIRSTKRKFGWWFYQKYKKKHNAVSDVGPSIIPCKV